MLNINTEASRMSEFGKLNAFSIGTTHADTGVREFIVSGKVFAVLTPISLIPPIAIGTNGDGRSGG